MVLVVFELDALDEGAEVVCTISNLLLRRDVEFMQYGIYYLSLADLLMQEHFIVQFYQIYQMSFKLIVGEAFCQKIYHRRLQQALLANY